MTERAMTCETFDERLPDYLDDTLDVAARAGVESHRATCLRCAALVRDLEEISSDARVLPELTPSRDLWDGIAERIETPVVSIGSATPRRRWDIVSLAAVAAVLVAATAGVTYRITTHQLAGRQVAVGMAPGDTANDSHVVPAGPESTSQLATAESQPDAARSRGRDADTERSVVAASRTPGSVTTTYDREIETLRTILRDGNADLDPRTVAILENNIRVIDGAIAESRAALTRDPASGFLREQLNRALDKKLELLRTVAMLRPRA